MFFDAHREDAVYCAGVKVPEHPEGMLKVSQASEVVEMFMDFLHQGDDVEGP